MTTTFPVGAALVNAAPSGGEFVAVVQGDSTLRDEGGSVILVPSGEYFAFGWRRPDVPEVWDDGRLGERQAIEIYQDGERAPMMTVSRKDGVDGDPDFNPLGLPGQSAGDYAYEVEVPRVTVGGDLRFLARSDGSAENILMKLDGGVDLNSQMGIGPMTGLKRDFAPGVNEDQKDDQGDGDFANDTVKQASTDTYLGYEQMAFVGRWNEKFAASDVARNVTGSVGAEVWEVTIGTAGVTRQDGSGTNSYHETANWIYHDPEANNQQGGSSELQFSPAPENADGVGVTVWVKQGYENEVDRMFLYYTTDGVSFPEGSGGVGKGVTEVVELTDTLAGDVDGTGQTRWWTGTLPAQTAGTVVRYKVGGMRNVVSSRFPFSKQDHDEIERMETNFEVTGFDATSIQYAPHNDYGEWATGLKEGFHVLRTRPFVGRGDGASIFRTNTQVFYYDVSRTTGEVAFPEENDVLGGSSYEVVVVTDATVTEVRYNILDGDTANDGAGNGSWANATLAGATTFLRDSGWAKEWRFEYTGIPAAGSANIQVRLMEESSSQDMNLSDEAGWYTTLSRNVVVGVGRTWEISEPMDGEVVNEGDLLRIFVSKDLVGGLTDQEFLSEVRILIASQTSGSPAGAVLQPLSTYSLNRDVTAVEHAVEFEFNNLFTGDPDFLHHVRAIHRRGGQTLTDTVLVKMAPGALADSDGDGLPDFWEGENGLQTDNPFGTHGAEGDYDFDGLTNMEEYVFGLDPRTDDASLAPQLCVVPVEGGFELEFPGLPGRLHTLLWSTDLMSWDELDPASTDLETEDEVLFEVTDETGGTKRFYRAQYEMKF